MRRFRHFLHTCWSAAEAIDPALWRIFALAIILLGAMLRFYQLGRDSLWLDEIITQRRTQRTVFDMVRWVWTYEEHPPLFYLLAYQNRLWGTSEFAARLPSAAAGILTIPVLMVFARKLWGRPAGLIAGLLLAMWPVHLYFSQEARQYALLTLFLSASAYWFYRGVTGGERRAWLGYALATLGALYTHYFALLWLAVQIGFMIAYAMTLAVRRGLGGFKKSWRRTFFPFLLALVGVIILFSPWLPSVVNHSRRMAHLPARGVQVIASETVFKLINGTLLFFAQDSVDFMHIVILLLAAGVVVGMLRKRWLALAFLLSLSFGPILALAALSFSHAYADRYLFPLLIPTILLITAAVQPFFLLLLGFTKRRRGVAVAGMTILMLVMIVIFFRPVQRYYAREKTDWRDAARFLASHMGPDDVVLVDGMFLGKSGDAARVEYALGYYLPDKPLLKVQADSVKDLKALQQRHLPNAAVWGVLWYQQWGELGDVSSLTGIEIWHFQDIVIVGVSRPSGDMIHDATLVLEAMRLLQPLKESHLDLDLMLGELYLEQDEWDKAARCTDEIMSLWPASAPQFHPVLFRLLTSAQIRQRLAAFDFIAQASTAKLVASTLDFPHFEQTIFEIDGSPRAVLMLHPPASLSYDIHIPADAGWLTFSVAMDPQTWNWGGDGVVFHLDVVASGESRALFSHRVTNDPADRHWRDVIIDMRPYRDQDVTLVFSVDPGPSADFTGDRGGWARPILWRDVGW